MSIDSLLRCERGAIEPFSDLPAISLVTIGFIIFTLVMGATYWSYAASAHAADQYSDALFILNMLRSDGQLTYEGRTDLLDAEKLEYYEANPQELRIPGPYRATVIVETQDTSWQIGDPPSLGCVSVGHAVNVRMNSATTTPATLYVALWRPG